MTSVHAMIHYAGDGSAVIVLEGEIDMGTAPVVHAALHRCTATCVCVDLAAVPFCDASGLNILLAAHRRLAARHGSLHVNRPSPAVQRILDLTGTTFLLNPGSSSHRGPPHTSSAVSGAA